MTHRWIVASFFIFSVAYTIRFDVIGGHFGFYFIYLTHLNLVGTMITTCFGAVLATLHYTDKFHVDYEMPVALKVFWALWNQSVAFSCIISITYWTLIYDEHHIKLNDILLHVTNSIVLLIDLLIVRHPPRYSQCVLLVPPGIAYLLFTFVYQMFGGLNK